MYTARMLGSKMKILIMSGTRVAPYIAVFALLLLSNSASASPVLNLTFTPTATAANCKLHAGSGDEIETGTVPGCTSTAYAADLASWISAFDFTGTFDGVDPSGALDFQTAFANWNVAQGAMYGGMWALKNGGDLDLTFNVTENAFADPNLGGISPFSITVAKNAGYVGPDIAQLVWAQALYVSYGTKPPYPTDLNPALHTLDTYSNSQGNTNSSAWLNPCQPIPGQSPGPNNTAPATIPPSPTNPTVLAYCDPIYPFQAAGAMFFDAPKAFWPDESFRAVALLSTVTFVTDAQGKIIERDLTVYNGVDWGFDLSVVPEPSTGIAVMLSLLAIAAIRRKRIR